MKVRINTDNRLKTKEKYYEGLRNLLDKLDDDFSKSKNSTEKVTNEDDNEYIIKQLNPNLKIKKIEICKICSQNEHKYICPKCKVKYCSVKCFKEHNTDCTENFYKKCVEEELKHSKINEKDKKNFKKNIQNIFNKQSHEDRIFEEEKLGELNQNKIRHLEELLLKINNNSFDLTRDLTKEDWESFNKFINGFSEDNNFNEINSLHQEQRNVIKIWKPFWESKLINGLEPNLNAYDLDFFTNLDYDSKQKIKEIELNEFIEFQSEEESNHKINTKDKNDIENIEKNFNFSQLNEITEEISENIEDFSNIIIPNKNDIRLNPEFLKNKIIKLNNKNIKIDRNILNKSIILKYESFPNLNLLSKMPPNDKNIYTLVDIILNMCYLFRLYNGELNDEEIILDIIAFFIENVKVLYDKEIFYENVMEVLNKFNLYISTYEFKHSKIIIEITFKDLDKILENKFYIIESFIRIYELLHKFLKDFKNHLNKYDFNQEGKYNKKYQDLIKKLMLAKHKILYFLSYVKGIESTKFKEIKYAIKNSIKENGIINEFGSKIKLFMNKN